MNPKTTKVTQAVNDVPVRKTEAACRLCGIVLGEDPAVPTPVCRSCFYGAYQEEIHATVLSHVRSRFQNARIYHTGGGCFAINIDWPVNGEERLFMLTDDDVSVPESLNGPWVVGYYTEDGHTIGTVEKFDSADEALAHVDKLTNAPAP